MLKHMIDILTNTYYIIENDTVVFSIELKDDNKIEAIGCKNFYKGDIKELKFNEDPSEE